MAAPPRLPPNLLTAALLFQFLFLRHSAAASAHPDAEPLLIFKSTADPNGVVLPSWNASSDPCTSGSWVGVSCIHNRVARLVLENLDLRGPFSASLTSLTELRVLSLKHNGLSGQLPDLSNLTNLKLLFVAHNRFSGDFPPSLPSLSKLYRLDLSYNNFFGRIPLAVNRLTHLLTLSLEENSFSGQISGLNLPSLQEFNVSGNNQLSGEIPASLSDFPASSFSNAPNLCGPPLEKCKSASSDPTQPPGGGGGSGGGGAMASPVTGSQTPTVSSTPTAIPSETKPPTKSRNRHRSRISLIAITGIIIGDVIVLGFVCLLLYFYFWKNHSNKSTSGKSIASQSEKIVYSSSPYPNPNPNPAQARGKMVFFDGERRFELEDLLRASAEMLGKGGFGTAYKAVLDDGNVVAVKRLKELNMSGHGRREFEQQMEILGKLRHPNLVGFKAYYYAMDEKLLVLDYMPNGSLFWLLHGNRGPGRTPLDWTTRLKIAAGAARGLAFIHSCKSRKLVHGNVKSTNVLIDKSGDAKLSDYGLSMFAPTSSGAPKNNGYRAPEAVLDSRKQNQKADVYSFGVLLLELLTGKCPSAVDGCGLSTGCGGAIDLLRWVQSVVREEWTAEVFDLELMRYKGIEEEMVGLLQIAMACTQAAPEQRPRINCVVKMIDELRGVEASPSLSHDDLVSISDSPSVSEDTNG
ncbi:probable leucine-rich repeat receptor-like protein kinase At1g68400 [Andrographis paniculata]|uniref:probable leucine-rich repeat receptor-like protein kinase At1g68400 n=1 Tax=Andrographis paniculata TaxID=175694 RepID=UPI0021E7FDA1|nr:probable leucine-rich repeat receptor-like protein kinase At1g68400 [Andrographis paniculata]